MPARKLLALEENLRRFEISLRAGYWTYDLRADRLHWSHGFYSLFGLKPDVIMPDISLASSLVHPDDQQHWGEVLASARKSRQMDRTIRIIRPDGQMIRVRSHYEGQFDRNGNLVAMLGTLIDISQQETEREEAEKGRAFANSLRALAHGVAWRAGPDGRLLDIGEWSRMTGETAEQAKDWNTLAAIHPEDRAGFRAAWKTGIIGRMPLTYRVRVRQRSGKYLGFENRALPILDDDGAIVEWHGFSFPIAAPSTGDAMQETQRLTSAQIRAARALIDWSGPDLAERSGISFSTIKRMEKSEELVKLDSVKRVRATLEAAGVRFSSGTEGDVSVTLVAAK
ncbi:PAS domain-containing protein [Rhizobium sp.]